MLGNEVKCERHRENEDL